MNYLSEKSTAYVKVALENLRFNLSILKGVKQGDTASVERALDEINVAIAELGNFNNRMTVHYEQLDKLWGLK